MVSGRWGGVVAERRGEWGEECTRKNCSVRDVETGDARPLVEGE